MFGVRLTGLWRVSPAVVVVTVALLAVGGVAQAALTDKRGAFHGCVGKSGVLRVIAPGRRCHRGQQAITFNRQGLPGATGAQGSTADPSQINALENRITALETNTGTLQQNVADLRSANAALTSRVGALEATLAGVTRSGSTLRFTGMNVQVVSGAGATDATPNGLGNLIIGYDDRPRTQTGSHNLVLGVDQTFTSYGGIIAGRDNKISAPFASVTGGDSNTASAANASVTGGGGNTASGEQSSVTGGGTNTADGTFASVTGGALNQANGIWDAILGGYSQTLAANSRCGTIPTGGVTCP